jgi:hypothetical protein
LEYYEPAATGQQIYRSDALGRAFAGTRTPGKILPFLLQRKRFTQIRATTSPREGAIRRA